MPISDDQNFWLSRFTQGKISQYDEKSLDINNQIRELQSTPYDDEDPAQIEQRFQDMGTLFEQKKLLNEKQLIVILGKEREEFKARREIYLKDARGRAEDIRTLIEKAYHAKIKTVKGRKMKMIAKDQTQAFDFEADLHDVIIGPEREALMSEAKIKLEAIRESLSEHFYYFSAIVDNEIVPHKEKEQLFPDGVVMKEFYTPLVRAKILPETFVPDDFSQVKKMLDDTNDAYMEELESISKTDELLQHTAFAKDMVSCVGSMASTSIEIHGAEKGLTTEQITNAKNISKLVEVSLTAGIDIVEAVATGDYQKGFENVLGGMADSVGFVVGERSGSEAIGDYVKYSMLSTKSLSEVVTAARNVKEDKGDALLAGLIDMVSCGFDFGGVDIDDEGKKADLKAAQAISVGILKTGLSAKKNNLIKAVRDGDWASIRSVLIDVSVNAATAAFTADRAYKEAALEEQKAKEEEAVKENQKKIDEEKAKEGGGDAAVLEKLKEKAEKLTEAFEKTSGDIEALTEIGDSIDESNEALNEALLTLNESMRATAEAHEEKKRQHEEAQKLQAEEFLRSEKEDFMDSLELLGQREVLKDGELVSISKLIAKMERDRIIMDVVLKAGAAGPAMASQILAPMAIAGTLVSFTASLAAAVDRCIQMRKWQEARSEALTAVSPYYTSIVNFVNNQKEQFAHHTIQAALLLLQAAAGITAAAGAGTPVQGVAEIVEKGLKLAQTTEELVYKIHKKIQLENAWRVTKFALENPSNRKAGLIARRLNPTLAKYSIAYGALIAKDPIAKTALNRIGLSNETLAQKDAGVASVKKYLEVRYSEDNVVLKAWKKPGGWGSKAPEPELKLSCWMFTVQLANTAGKVTTGQDNKVNMAMRKAEDQLENFEDNLKTSTLDIVSCDNCLAALSELRMALNVYRPTGEKNRTDESMASIVTVYKGLVDASLTECEMEKSNLEMKLEALQVTTEERTSQALEKLKVKISNSGDIKSIAIVINQLHADFKDAISPRLKAQKLNKMHQEIRVQGAKFEGLKIAIDEVENEFQDVDIKGATLAQWRSRISEWVENNRSWANYTVPTDGALEELKGLIDHCMQLTVPLHVAIDSYRDTPEDGLLASIQRDLAVLEPKCLDLQRKINAYGDMDAPVNDKTVGYYKNWLENATNGGLEIIRKWREYDPSSARSSALEQVKSMAAQFKAFPTYTGKLRNLYDDYEGARYPRLKKAGLDVLKNEIGVHAAKITGLQSAIAAVENEHANEVMEGKTVADWKNELQQWVEFNSTWSAYEQPADVALAAIDRLAVECLQLESPLHSKMDTYNESPDENLLRELKSELQRFEPKIKNLHNQITTYGDMQATANGSTLQQLKDWLEGDEGWLQRVKQWEEYEVSS